jgi:glycosyltransferase involved in cell wall biosynthesis
MKYSIITVNYNDAQGLEDTIKSVISQTCHDYEFIIIDGNSTDKSKSIIKENQSQIDYWVSEPDNGIFNAMNKGILASKGEYLIFMNSGDCFYNKKVLEDSLQYLKSDFVIGGIKRKDDDTTMNYELSDISMMTFYNGAIPHQATFHKRSLFQNSLYDETLKISSDWKFFFQKIILQNATYNLMPVVVCSFDTNGISNTNTNWAAKERNQIISESLPARVIKDYERYKDKECEMLDLIPQFKYTRTINKVITRFAKMVLYLYKRKYVK